MRVLVALALMPVLFFSGCGKKGDPRAPELATPRVIENLRATSDPNGVALTWSRPTQYVDGTELKDLVGFVIFRKEISPTCVDCPAPYRPLTTVDIEDREKFVKQKQYRYLDEEAQAENDLSLSGVVPVEGRFIERAIQ